MPSLSSDHAPVSSLDSARNRQTIEMYRANIGSRIAWLPTDLHTSLFLSLPMSWLVPGCSLRCLAKLRSQIAPRVSSGVGALQIFCELFAIIHPGSSGGSCCLHSSVQKWEAEDWQLLNGVSVAMIPLLVLIVVVIFEKLSCGIWGKNRLTCDPGQRLMAK